MHEKFASTATDHKGVAVPVRGPDVVPVVSSMMTWHCIVHCAYFIRGIVVFLRRSFVTT